MPRTRGERGGGTLSAAINGPSEEDKTNDVEDGLREPLLSRHGDGDAGDGDNSGRAAETENDDTTTAAAAVAEKEGVPETKPSSFIDLFFFADRVSRGVIEGQRMDVVIAVWGQGIHVGVTTVPAAPQQQQQQQLLCSSIRIRIWCQMLSSEV